jgi:hypothetical protein
MRLTMSVQIFIETWFIKSLDHPELDLDCKTRATRDGTLIIANHYTGQSTQKWTLDDAKLPIHSVAAPTQVMDIGKRNGFSRGSDVILWRCTGSCNQWRTFDKSNRRIVAPSLNLGMRSKDHCSERERRSVSVRRAVGQPRNRGSAAHLL